MTSTNRDQLLAEARRTWKAFQLSGTDEDYKAAQKTSETAREVGVTLAEIVAE
ncbi:hypothetical protein [Streptomyces sp. NBC_01716]|uniref:hypothetical protein n=1 Tax=Streptomyces sp. NBC_01716 TaxID=2975917 RepID=UPI002E338AAB|nr:hypothetical protein [Streptomyces sp. NBC_01716]